MHIVRPWLRVSFRRNISPGQPSWPLRWLQTRQGKEGQRSDHDIDNNRSQDKTVGSMELHRTHQGTPEADTPEAETPEAGVLTGNAASTREAMLSMVRPHAPLLLGGVCLGTASTGISLVLPMALGKILDVSLGADTTMTPGALSVGLGGLFCAQAVLMVCRTQLLNTAGERLSCDIRHKAFASVARQDIAFFDSNNTGELINRLSADTALLQKVMTTQLANGLRGVMMIAGSGACLVWTSPWLSLLSFSMFPPVFAVATAAGRRMKKQQRGVQDALASATETAQRTLLGVRTLRLFGAEESEIQRYG